MSKYITRTFNLQFRKLRVYNTVDKIEQEIEIGTYSRLSPALIEIEELDKREIVQLRRMTVEDFYINSEEVKAE